MKKRVHQQYSLLIEQENFGGEMTMKKLVPLYGYNTSSVAEINKKMTDDVKVILAEYRLALKKNNSDRAK